MQESQSSYPKGIEIHSSPRKTRVRRAIRSAWTTELGSTGISPIASIPSQLAWKSLVHLLRECFSRIGSPLEGRNVERYSDFEKKLPNTAVRSVDGRMPGAI